MYKFLKLQYQLGKITDIRLQTAVTKGYITQTEYDAIIAQ